MDMIDKNEFISKISKEKMDDLLKVFSTLDRLSGEPDERKGIEYITGKLEDYGVDYKVHEFDAYLSDPVKGHLEVLSPVNETLVCKTRSFSVNIPEGLEGELVYVQNVGEIFDDDDGDFDIFHSEQNLKSANPVKGKIIVSEGGSPQHIASAEKLGAIGLIHVWPSEEEYIHEMISSPVWGQPTMETSRDLPRIPEVSVTNKTGQALIELARKGTTRVRIRTEVRNSIKKLRMPEAYIPGKTDKYVLVCGHIDSWHYGITDNAVGNALCLEIARVFAPYAGKLKRGIKVIWWSGHSNGRYTGSTWYCDNFFEDLKENCVFMINNDSPGVKHGGTNLLRTALSEKKNYFHNIVKEVSGKDAEWDFPIRAGDYSFWGTGIPQQMMLRNIPDPGFDQAVVGGSGGGWWWHTEEDTYDKMDLDNLFRDTAINAAIVGDWTQAELLPIDLVEMTARMTGIIENIQKNSEAAFDFTPAFKALEKLAAAAGRLEAARESIDPEVYNNLLQFSAGRMATLMFSASSKYYQDPACAQGPFPGLARVKGLKDINELELIFHKTDFVKQRNRFVMETGEVVRGIDLTLRASVKDREN